MRLPYSRVMAGPAWAQAVSFGAVVVAGLVLGHGVVPLKVTQPVKAAQPVKAPQQAGTSLTIAAQPSAGAGRAVGGRFQSARVAVLDAGSLTLAAAGRLGSADSLVVRVPAGAYAVCALPPRPWRPADATAIGPAGWACAEITVGVRPAAAELTFAETARKHAGGRP